MAIPARSKPRCLERKGAGNGELLVASAPTLGHRKPRTAQGGPSSASFALQTSQLDQDDCGLGFKASLVFRSAIWLARVSLTREGQMGAGDGLVLVT